MLSVYKCKDPNKIIFLSFLKENNEFYTELQTLSWIKDSNNQKTIVCREPNSVDDNLLDIPVPDNCAIFVNIVTKEPDTKK